MDTKLHHLMTFLIYIDDGHLLQQIYHQYLQMIIILSYELYFIRSSDLMR